MGNLSVVVQQLKKERDRKRLSKQISRKTSPSFSLTRSPSRFLGVLRLLPRFRNTRFHR
jgi:hypothetical protein